jgi:hypothetical protein
MFVQGVGMSHHPTNGAGRAVGGLKKYPAINANIKAAEAERNLILQGLKKQREAAQNNPASGKPKP